MTVQLSSHVEGITAAKLNASDMRERKLMAQRKNTVLDLCTKYINETTGYVCWKCTALRSPDIAVGSLNTRSTKEYSLCLKCVMAQAQHFGMYLKSPSLHYLIHCCLAGYAEECVRQPCEKESEALLVARCNNFFEKVFAVWLLQVRLM